jgi:hypothetical protein
MGKRNNPPKSQYLIFTIFVGIVLVTLTIAIFFLVTSRSQFGIDFYVYWLAGKEMFIRGGNPYSEEVSREAQIGIIGRPAQPHEDHHSYLNPPFSLLAILPTVWMSYSWAFAFWISLNLVALLVISRLSFPQLPVWIPASLPFFYPVARAVVMGQFSLIIFILFLGIHGLIFRRETPSVFWLTIAGVILAWTTGKPQLTWLLIGFYLIVSIRKGFWVVWVGFLVGFLSFTFISFYWISDWPSAWFNQSVQHAEVFQPEIWIISSLSQLINLEMTIILSIVVIVLCAFICVVITIRWMKGLSSSVLVLAWFVLLVSLLNPYYRPPDQIILLLPILYWISENQHQNNRWIAIVWILGFLIPWTAFTYTFTGHEGVTTFIWTPLLYIIWILSITFITGNFSSTRIARNVSTGTW